MPPHPPLLATNQRYANLCDSPDERTELQVMKQGQVTDLSPDTNPNAEPSTSAATTEPSQPIADDTGGNILLGSLAHAIEEEAAGKMEEEEGSDVVSVAQSHKSCPKLRGILKLLSLLSLPRQENFEISRPDGPISMVTISTSKRNFWAAFVVAFLSRKCHE